MKAKAEQLGQLARIARARADMELRRYAACRAQSDALRAHVEAIRAELAAAIGAPVADSVDQWRLTTALVAYRADEVHRAEGALARMQPAVDAARAAAAQAFGRAEAISELRSLQRSADAQSRVRRSE